MTSRSASRCVKQVKFHDGVEMTADDVAYTFSSERLWGPEAIKTIPLGKSYSLQFDEPLVEDKYTVVLRTKTPSYLIETYAASWMSRIVPKDYYKKLGNGRIRQQTDRNGSVQVCRARCRRPCRRSKRTTTTGVKNRLHRKSRISSLRSQLLASPASSAANTISSRR